jgi:hypothetical protein
MLTGQAREKEAIALRSAPPGAGRTIGGWRVTNESDFLSAVLNVGSRFRGRSKIVGGGGWCVGRANADSQWKLVARSGGGNLPGQMESQTRIDV